VCSDLTHCKLYEHSKWEILPRW